MSGKYNILIIDDNKETVADLKSFLENEYSIVAAYDGFRESKGLKLIRVKKISLPPTW